MVTLKKSLLNYGVILAASLFIITGCDESSPVDNVNDVASLSTSTEIFNIIESDTVCYGPLLTDLPIEELSEVEKSGILFMREEEKLARDVYLVLYDTWGLIPFRIIPKSEQMHMDAILLLINRYGLEDPAEGKDIGEFENEDLQQLYNELIELGSVSAVEALKVGALIEEVDIEDLENIINDDIDNADIAMVYGNLLRGSGYHLNAFVWNLGNLDVIYNPQVLSQDEFDEIIND